MSMYLLVWSSIDYWGTHRSVLLTPCFLKPVLCVPPPLGRVGKKQLKKSSGFSVDFGFFFSFIDSSVIMREREMKNDR